MVNLTMFVVFNFTEIARPMPRKKTAAKTHPSVSPKDSAVDAALRLAAVMPWDMVSMADIAGEAGMDLAVLHDLFDDRADILAVYGKRIDRKVLAVFSAPDATLSEKDRLFDILMERFDVLKPDRKAVLSILDSFRRDPKQAVISLPHLGRSMMWMVEAAGLSTSGVGGALRVAGAGAVYLYALNAWKNDDSADLSVTMAALDKALTRAEQVAGWLPV
jgi:ubiquinone biosynthesis protein COQ9